MASLTHLRALEAQATPAPWYSNVDPELPRSEEGDIEWPEHLGVRFPQQWDYYINEADANLIVALRNATPVVFSIIVAARQLINAWNTDDQIAARARLNSALQRLEDI